jgi:hypothetical protein
LGYTVYRHHGQLYAALKGQAWEKADWAEGACLQFRFWPYSFFDVENIRISPQAPENPVAPSEEKTALALDLKALDSVDGWVSDEVVLRGRKVRLFFELFAPEEDSPSIDGALGVNIGIATDAILGSYEQIVKEGQRGLIFTLMESDKKISFSYELKDDVLTLVLQEANWPHFGKISGAYKFHQRKP